MSTMGRALRIVVLALLVSVSPGLVSPAPVWAASGDKLWFTTWDGALHQIDVSRDIAVDPAGTRVFVTGYSTVAEGGYGGWATIAYSASTGKQLWVALVATPNYSNFAWAIAVAPDGSNVYVTGIVKGSATTCEIGTVAYDAATGAALWARVYAGAGPTYGCQPPVNVLVSPGSNRVYVATPTLESTLNGETFTILAYSSTGRRLWVAHSPPDVEVDKLTGAAIAPDGSKIFLTGQGGLPNSGLDFLTMAFGTRHGALQWMTYYSTPDADYPSAIAVTPDSSRLYVVGIRDTVAALVAYDSGSGAEQWRTEYHDHRFAQAISTSPDGSKVFMVASGDPYSGWMTRAVSSGGQTLWERTYSNRTGDVTETPYAVGSRPDGSAIYVTGLVSSWDWSYRWATVKYRVSDGTQLWARMIDGRSRYGPISGDALAIPPAGDRVFVTGQSADGTTADTSGYIDYGTVAYAA